MKSLIVMMALVLAAPSGAAPCALTAADKAANAALSYDDFDQKATTPSSFRALDVAGCYAEAADAAEDYMLHHPDLLAWERTNILFHEGQTLAQAGDERAAARVIAATRNLNQKPDDPFDWNTYVEGTWAFLVKDRGRLEAASATLNRPGSGENAINGKVLRGLVACFYRPYKEAYGACRPK